MQEQKKFINRKSAPSIQTSKQSTHKLDQFKTPTRTTKKINKQKSNE